MLRRDITYTDFNGETRTEPFYFNLTKAELMEMEMSFDGGLTKTINSMVETKDSKRIVALFKEIILKSYGEKTADGKRFMKNADIRDSFAQSEAYSELFMELISDENAAKDFINGIVPKVEQTPGQIADK